LPLALARARRESESAFDDITHDAAWVRDVSSSGLVGAGLQMVSRWFKERG
jgi:hypothetical protein